MPGTCAASTRPPVAATPLSSPRRLTLTIFVLVWVLSSVIARSSSGATRGSAHGRVDSLVAAAAAEVARHGLGDLTIGRPRRLCQEGGGLHDLAGLAIAALRHAQVAPGDLHRMIALGAKPLDRRH